MKKAIRKKRRKYITLKFIRGTTKNIRSIRLPRALFNIMLGGFATFLLFVGVMTYATSNLNQTYQYRLDDIKRLENTNMTQQREIETLSSITAEVRAKLESLKATEEKVKEMVGIGE